MRTAPGSSRGRSNSHNRLKESYVVNRTTTDARPERLSQRWALILTAAFVVGAVVFTLAGPLAALGAAGATVIGLDQLVD